MNSNYPDGTWEGDPCAPWNQPDDEPEPQEEVEFISSIQSQSMSRDCFEEFIRSLDLERIVRCNDCGLSSYGKEGLQCDARKSVGSFKVPEDGFCHLGTPEEKA